MVLPEGFYSPQLHGVSVELRLLADLLGRSHGALLMHMQRLGVSLEAACSKWLMCLFVTVPSRFLEADERMRFKWLMCLFVTASILFLEAD